MCMSLVVQHNSSMISDIPRAKVEEQGPGNNNQKYYKYSLTYAACSPNMTATMTKMYSSTRYIPIPLFPMIEVVKIFTDVN